MLDVSRTARESTKPFTVGFHVLQCAFALLADPDSVSKLFHALIPYYTTSRQVMKGHDSA
jgi:hypothetical protein